MPFVGLNNSGSNISFSKSSSEYLTEDSSLIDMVLIIDSVSRWMALFSIIFGTLGNLTTILIYTKQRVLPAYRKLLINLAACDLAYCFLMAFWLHRRFSNHTWIFGSVMCKLSAFRSSTLVASMFTITTIAYERYLKIQSPLSFRMSTHKIITVTTCIWSMSLAAYIPILYRKEVRVMYRNEDCVTIWKPNEITFKKYYNVFLFILSYPLPLINIGYVYSKICWKALKGFNLRKFNSEQERHIRNERHDFRRPRKYKKLFLMLVLVLLSFVLTTTPNHAYILWVDFAAKENKSIDDLRRQFIALHFLSSLIYFHVWLNPLIYNIADGKYRKQLRVFWQETVMKRILNCPHLSNSSASNKKKPIRKEGTPTRLYTVVEPKEGLLEQRKGGFRCRRDEKEIHDRHNRYRETMV